MVYLLSAGFVLVVWALRLWIMKQAMHGSKVENIAWTGVIIFLVGGISASLGRSAAAFKWITVGEANVLANTGVAVLIIGAAMAIQAALQRRKATESYVWRLSCGFALSGVIFIILWFFLR